MTAEVSGLALLFFASVAAGGVNAIAGGGTILTFAVLSAVLPPGPGRLVSANMTSTIALWPGSVAATWAHRDEWSRLPRAALWLVVPSVVGAVIGVTLLQVLPAKSFDLVVPWLILLAAVLFAVQPSITRAIGAVGSMKAPRDQAGGRRDGGPSHVVAGSEAASHPQSPDCRRGLVWGMSLRFAAILFFQLLVGIYGGYFGAGIGILMLASLGLLGLGDIHALNAVKNLLAAAVNGVATVLFIIAALTGGFEVWWIHVAVAAIGAVVGGIVVAKASRRLPATAVRRLVAIIAFGLAGYHLWKEWSPS
jgi:uncharacterized membrane protein YfcA